MKTYQIADLAFWASLSRRWRASALAMKGEGASLDRPHAARISLHVAAPVPVSEMHGIVGTNFLPEPMRSQVNSRLSRLATTAWFRCAAHEYRLAAAGGVHMLFYNKLMPWDEASFHAARAALLS
jgi:fructose-1,6-bisphosphatase/inositol monophosphatase family enzyme